MFKYSEIILISDTLDIRANVNGDLKIVLPIHSYYGTKLISIIPLDSRVKNHLFQEYSDILR